MTTKTPPPIQTQRPTMSNKHPSIIGGFRKFERTSQRIVDKITITNTGIIGTSTSFSKEHSISSYTGAILFWNEQTQEIGIQFASTGNIGALPLRANSSGYGYMIAARSFFKINHLDVSKYRGKYDYRVIPFGELDPDHANEGMMFVFAVREANS